MNKPGPSLTPEPGSETEPLQVFFASPWVPAEWIKAHGLQPRGIWHAKSFDLGVSSGAGACAFAAGILSLGTVEAKAACIFTTHCDQLRRCFDTDQATWGRLGFLFNLPSTWGSEMAFAMYRAELERLGRFLVSLGGTAPNPAALAGTMAGYRQKRVALCGMLGKECARSAAEAVLRFHWCGSAERSTASKPLGRGVPLALVGGPLPASRLGLFDVVEALGATIVLNATEPGERSLWEADAAAPLPLERSALLDTLAREYLSHCIDVFQRPNTRLYEWLQSRIRLRNVQGIVLWHYTGCDLWSAEAYTLRETFGLPVLALEADDAAALTLRDRSRLEAFIESLA